MGEAHVYVAWGRGDMVLRTGSQLRDMRDPGRFSPTVIWVVPGAVPSAGEYRDRTRFLSWVPRMLRAKEGTVTGSRRLSSGQGQGSGAQEPGPGHRGGQGHPAFPVVFRAPPPPPPWDAQSPLAQAPSLGPRSTCERQGGQPVLPQGETGTERDHQAWSSSW